LGEKAPPGGVQTASVQAQSAPSIAAPVIAESSASALMVAPLAGVDSIPIGPGHRTGELAPAKLERHAELSAFLIANAHATLPMESTSPLRADPPLGVELGGDNAPAIDIFFEQLPSKSVDFNQQCWPDGAREAAVDMPGAENSLEGLTDAVIKDHLDWQADLLGV
jgi:hypothetical protein